MDMDMDCSVNCGSGCWGAPLEGDIVSGVFGRICLDFFDSAPTPLATDPMSEACLLLPTWLPVDNFLPNTLPLPFLLLGGRDGFDGLTTAVTGDSVWNRSLQTPVLLLLPMSLFLLKRWSSTSISTLMLVLGRCRMVLWGTMATESVFGLEFEVVLVAWLAMADLDSGSVGSATVTGGLRGTGDVGSLAAIVAS